MLTHCGSAEEIWGNTLRFLQWNLTFCSLLMQISPIQLGQYTCFLPNTISNAESLLEHWTHHISYPAAENSTPHGLPLTYNGTQIGDGMHVDSAPKSVSHRRKATYSTGKAHKTSQGDELRPRQAICEFSFFSVHSISLLTQWVSNALVKLTFVPVLQDFFPSFLLFVGKTSAALFLLSKIKEPCRKPDRPHYRSMGVCQDSSVSICRWICHSCHSSVIKQSHAANVYRALGAQQKYTELYCASEKDWLRSKTWASS